MQQLDPGFHIQNILNDYGEIVRQEYVLDEDGEVIPTTMCICHAYEPNECCCGAWDGVEDWDYD